MNAAYPLWPIIILIVAFYSLSFAFSRIGLLSKSIHRKFWNVLLLLVFLVSGLLGFFMVVKINYKLQVPFYEKLVSYHVEFGIAMALIGFFHLWWHLNYYLKVFRQGLNSVGHNPKLLKQLENEAEGAAFNTHSPLYLFKISAFLLGSTTIIAQVILMREFLTVFSGNELVIGMILANWMMLTGLGAYFGRQTFPVTQSPNFLINGLSLLSVMPFATAFLINFLKNKIFPVGALISIFQIFWSSFVLLVPFCLLSGFLFTLISSVFSEHTRQNKTGYVYGFESVGSVAGGLLSGLLFIFVFSSVESLLILVLVNGLVLIFSTRKFFPVKQIWFLLPIVFAAFAALFFHPEKLVRSFVYPNQEIVASKDSPFGNMVVTRREKLWSVYQDNNLLFDSENFMLNEEAVHFPMIQHQHPGSVLLISGDLVGQLNELKKYHLSEIDFIEENRWLMTLLKDSLSRVTDPAVRIVAIDPVRFVRKTMNTYDVVILNLYSPSTMQSNRFYTVDFYEALKKRMAPDGIVSFGIAMPVNYQNQEATALNSTLLASLKTSFRNVIILPGEKLYFLASDAPLSYHIAELIGGKGIETRYVNSDYFNDSLLQQRGELIQSALHPGAPVNQNLKPVAYNQQILFWLSQFSGRYWILAALTGLLAFLVFFRGNMFSQTMFVTGFSGSSLEMVLLFGLQVFFGNIYLLTSFVFTGFMAGLAFGAFLGKNLSWENGTLRILLCMAVLAFLSGLLLQSDGAMNLPEVLVYSLYLIAVVLLGSLTGLQFTQVSRKQAGGYSEISGKTYGYDLAGSALGALVVTIFLVPFFGIIQATWVIAGINLLFASWIFLKTRV